MLYKNNYDTIKLIACTWLLFDRNDVKAKVDIATKNLNDNGQQLNVPRPDQEICFVVLVIGLAIATVIGLTVDLESRAIGDFDVFEMKYMTDLN